MDFVRDNRHKAMQHLGIKYPISKEEDEEILRFLGQQYRTKSPKSSVRQRGKNRDSLEFSKQRFYDIYAKYKHMNARAKSQHYVQISNDVHHAVVDTLRYAEIPINYHEGGETMKELFIAWMIYDILHVADFESYQNIVNHFIDELRRIQQILQIL